MAITSITIENFKGIGDAVTIPIRPITLLFGKNSSGKSTVLQALRYLHKICEGLKIEQKLQEMRDREKSKDLELEAKRDLHDTYEILEAVYVLRDKLDDSNFRKKVQTIISEKIPSISQADLSNFDSLRAEALKSIQKFILEEALIKLEENQIELEAGREHGQIDPDHFTELGGFHSLVHRQELDRKIRIRLEFDEPEKLKSLNGILSLAMKPEGVTNSKSAWIEMVTGWDEKQRIVYLDSYKYALNGAEWICLTPANRSMSDDAEWSYEGRFIDLNIYSKNFALSDWMKDLSWLLGTNNSEGKKFGLSESKLKNIRPWLEKCVFEYRAKDTLKNLHNIVLGALKDIRHLGPVRDVPRRDGDSSEGSEGPTGLWAWRDLKDPLLAEKTNHYMKKLALGYSIRPSEDSEHEIQLYDDTHKIYLHPLDVGFGISQVIPVVVGALDDTSQIFAVEQPELHVHPAVQVALGDVFIDGIENSNRTMLIETHSEHLLLRLLRRVRETTRRSRRRQTTELEQTAHELTPNDLSVVYVRPTPAGVKFTPLTVTDNGDFDAPWPEGFFDERDSELF